VRGKKGKKNTERTSGPLNLKLSGWDSVCISPTDMAEAWDHHTQPSSINTRRIYQTLSEYQKISEYQDISENKRK
jgi:hypothetical protein